MEPLSLSLLSHGPAVAAGDEPSDPPSSPLLPTLKPRFVGPLGQLRAARAQDFLWFNTWLSLRSPIQAQKALAARFCLSTFRVGCSGGFSKLIPGRGAAPRELLELPAAPVGAGRDRNKVCLVVWAVLGVNFVSTVEVWGLGVTRWMLGPSGPARLWRQNISGPI